MRSSVKIHAALAACVLALGCGGGGGSSSITVAGKIFPPPGATSAKVVIGELSAVPDPDTGAFQIAGVTTPYDLVAVVGDTGVLYQGLTRKDPVIIGGTKPPQGARTGTLSGNVSISPVLPGTTLTLVSFGSPETEDHGSVSSGAYSLTPHWSGAASTTGTLHALQLQKTSDSDYRPASYSGYVQKTGVTLTDGGTSVNDLTVAPVGSDHVSGTVTVPPGYTVSMTFGDLVFADGSWVNLFFHMAPSGTFSYLAPSIDGASVTLSVSGSNADGSAGVTRSHIAAGATGVELSVPSSPVRGSPANGATGVTTGTVFTWTPFANGVHVVGFGSATPGLPKFAVVTAGSSASIPDLSALGLPLPKGADYSWRVQAYGPFESLDDAADAAAIQKDGIAAPGDVAYEGTSTVGKFTTAP